MLRAFHNDPSIKAMYLARVHAHALADEIIHGQYWENGKGCAIGCTLHSSTHAAYETELGIPAALAHLEDRIFEGLRPPQDKTWPADFLQAIPVGADLSDIPRQFLLALLIDPQHGVRQYVLDAQWRIQREAVDAMIALLEEGRPLVDAAARAARVARVARATRAAEAAAYDAAEAAEWCAYDAVRAAEAAAEAAARAAHDAARDAEAAVWCARSTAWAAAEAARVDHFLWQRDLLLTLVARVGKPIYALEVP